MRKKYTAMSRWSRDEQKIRGLLGVPSIIAGTPELKGKRLRYP